MKEPQTMTGVILPNGELRIDESLVLGPGRVRIIVSECPPDDADSSPWAQLESQWSRQRTRYLQMSEVAAMEASKAPATQESTAIATLSPTAADLRDFMSQLSEDCYCAGWMHDLEYLLWSAVMNGPVHQGNWDITQSDIDRLRLLARRAGGWIIWDKSLPGEACLPIDQWLMRYEQYVATHGSSAS